MFSINWTSKTWRMQYEIKWNLAKWLINFSNALSLRACFVSLIVIGSLFLFFSSTIALHRTQFYWYTLSHFSFFLFPIITIYSWCYWNHISILHVTIRRKDMNEWTMGLHWMWCSDLKMKIVKSFYFVDRSNEKKIRFHLNRERKTENGWRERTIVNA